MRKEQKDIDPSLNLRGILREALKILRTHAKVFVLIQLTLMLGLAIFKVGAEYVFSKMFPDSNAKNYYNHPAPTATAQFLYSLSEQNFAVSFHEDSPVMKTIILWLLFTGNGIILKAFQCLSLATTLYSVGLHYAGQAVSFRDVIRASIPHLWMRLAVTTTYNYVMVNSISLVQSVGFGQLPHNQALRKWEFLGWIVSMGLSSFAELALSALFAVASGVSVLGEDYGWASMAKGLKLLKGKLKVAIKVQALLWLPGHIVGLLVLYYEIHHDALAALFAGLFVPTVVIEIISKMLIWRLTAVCSGVQYASFKAYHDEKITDALHQKRAKEGYVLMVDRTNGALLGGPQVGSKV